MSNTNTWTAKDDGYFYTKVTLTVKGEDLTIKLSGRYVKPITTVVKNFKEYTACELMLMYDYGRHFEKALMDMYKELGISFGSHQTILRAI